MTAQDTDDEDRAAVPDDGYASRDEAAEAITALTDTDFVRSMLLARIHWKQRKLRDLMRPEELLDEAIVRTLSIGQRPRRWRKAVVSIIEHLDRTMESISGHAVGDAVAEAAILNVVRSEEIDPRTAAPRRFHRPVAEDQLLAREQLEEIEQSFIGVPRALAFLRLKAEGYTESEIMERLGIDSGSTRRRARKPSAPLHDMPSDQKER